ncbi:hypothetical protein HOD29_01075 [archaeon]|jgi:hypothetical protein|nr:hypothetical protein [archaeon]
MGRIISSKTLPDKKVAYKILMDQHEVSNLKGHLKNIYLFNSNLCNKETCVNTRGNNGVTKYFKIPLSVRSRKKPTGELSYHKIETPSKSYYIYILNKEAE